MATQLYETLGVAKDASPDEIRKAYRQMALKTHPDKQPQGISDKDKHRAREKFEKVSNAYEILRDEEKRQLYDRHGMFPPLEVPQDPYADFAESRHRRRSHKHSRRHGFDDAFNDPFFKEPFVGPGSRSRSRNDPFFGFTDPFTLFNEIFGDMHRQFDDPFFRDPFPSASPFGRSPFGGGSLFDRFMGAPPGFGMLPPSGTGQSMSFQSTSRGMLARGLDGQPQWVSQSTMTRSVNGQTETVCKRTDSNGNEHVTYSYPDGRERYLINGVEQSAGSRGERSLPPPPPYPGPPAPLNTSHRPNDPNTYRQDRNHSPYSPTYPQHAPGSYAEPTPRHGRDYEREKERVREHHRGLHRKHRHSHENYEAYDRREPPRDTYRSQYPEPQPQLQAQPQPQYEVHHDDHHHKRRWWKGEW